MLKYVITLSIISFCNAIPSTPVIGDFDLILVQHSLITAFSGPHRSVNSSEGEVLHYIAEHPAVFDNQRWIIHGLWALHSNNEVFTECETSDGTKPTYKHENLNNDFIQILKTRWPPLSTTGIEANLWQTNYNTYGSCVTTNVTYYFEEAVRLADKFEMGYILRDAKIFTDTSYTLDYIYIAIKSTIQKRVYLKCVPAENPQQQYLLEVKLCFDRYRNLAHCHQLPGLHECERNKSVIYPGIPEN